MKKVTYDRTQFVPPVKLYRDDLDQLLADLSGQFGAVKIADSEFEYDTLDELGQKRGSKIKELLVQASSWEETSSFLAISFNRQVYGTHIYGRGPKTELNFPKVREFLISHRNMVPHYLKWFAWAVLTLVALFILANYNWTTTTHWVSGSFRLLTVALVGLLFGFAINIFFQHGRFNAISLNLRHKSPSFWSRNKDKIMIAFISAIAGGFAMWVFSLIKN